MSNKKSIIAGAMGIGATSLLLLDAVGIAITIIAVALIGVLAVKIKSRMKNE